MEKLLFTVGELVVCTNVERLKGHDGEICKVAPPLEMDKTYTVNRITLDSAGNQHLDVGLKSQHAYITSIETGEELPESTLIHWCHPSRFKK